MKSASCRLRASTTDHSQIKSKSFPCSLFRNMCHTTLLTCSSSREKSKLSRLQRIGEVPTKLSAHSAVFQVVKQRCSSGGTCCGSDSQRRRSSHFLLKRTGDAGQSARQRNTPGSGCDDTVAALRWNELLTTTPAVHSLRRELRNAESDSFTICRMNRVTAEQPIPWP